MVAANSARRSASIVSSSSAAAAASVSGADRDRNILTSGAIPPACATPSATPARGEILERARRGELHALVARAEQRHEARDGVRLRERRRAGRCEGDRANERGGRFLKLCVVGAEEIEE